MQGPKEAYEPWDPEVTYVVGHQRPDTDAIASALGYAWLLQQTGQENVVASRAGQPGPQVLFALKRFEQAAPKPLTLVAPTFFHAAQHEPAVSPEAPLRDALARLATGSRVVPVVAADRQPAGAVTLMALARAWQQNELDRLERPCRDVAEPLSVFRDRDRISDHRSFVLRCNDDDFLVVDDANRYVGMATRARVLQPPQARLILVDHNELEQAVAGANEAEIVAVLDHHRLGNPPTAAPIPFVVEPVGSTSTLVAEQCRTRELAPPPGLAGMLLAGILSDTLVFRSPTTTGRDRVAGDWLAALARTDLAGFGAELLGASPGLGTRTADEVVEADRKTYAMGGVKVSVAQVEVTGLFEVAERRDALLQALDAQRLRESLGLACLMITDIVAGRSRLLARGEDRFLVALPFARLNDDQWELGEIVSRKKQLVPALHGVLEESF